jgi:hypothetical protein
MGQESRASWLLFSHWFSSFELIADLRETLMIGTSKILAVAACCFALLVGASAQAGILAVHPSAYNDTLGPAGGAWRGTAPYVNDGLNGTIDWAVFTRASFDAAFPGNGYVSPANELVYAHQIFSAGPLIGVTGMDIFLAGNPAGNGGSYSISGVPLTEVPAISAYADSTLATYTLAEETDPLTPSEGLVYSSPNRPQLTGVPIVVDGGISASTELPIGIPGPNAIPEPATALIATLAAAFMFAFRRVHRG